MLGQGRDAVMLHAVQANGIDMDECATDSIGAAAGGNGAGGGEGDQLLARMIACPERARDARVLAEMGFGPGIISTLTGWPSKYGRVVCERYGRRHRGGKARSELAEIVKVPMCHSAISQFVMAVEHQLEYWGDTRLTTRVLVRAIQYTQDMFPDAMAMIPVSGLYTIAAEALKKTVKTVQCKHCRGSYAQISLASGLTGMVLFDCPVCRMFNLMLKSRKHSVEDCVPTSFADLKLNEPFMRYVSKGADRNVVHAIYALSQGLVSRRVN